ncbi:Tellurium resistance [Clostridium acetobutylicum]|nr:Tellurium resistance [Clostridium acetobutylicum]
MAIILEKGIKVNLAKKESIGKINVNLNWNQGNKESDKDKNKGFFAKIFGKDKEEVVDEKVIDLDLGCLYELKDGKKGIVQALGNKFGSYNENPYIFLDGDDRDGNSLDGENLVINGSHLKDIKRILIYTFIYEGAVKWSEVDGVVTIKRPDEEHIVINMDEYRSGMRMCALAMIQNVNDQNFSVEKLVKYFPGHEAMDRKYHWGLKWKSAKK